MSYPAWYTTTTTHKYNTSEIYNHTNNCTNVSGPKFDRGTTWGKKINDSVTAVDFEPNEFSVTTHIIYYDTKENLEKIGIVFKKEKEVFFPKAFGVFAKPPKNWKG